MADWLSAGYPDTQLFSRGDVAMILGVTTSTVLWLERMGVLPASVTQGQQRFSVRDIVATGRRYGPKREWKRPSRCSKDDHAPKA